MSDRDEVRGLAREILRLAGPTTHLNYPAQLDDAERRLLAFLAQREAALQAQLHRALGEGARLREALSLVAPITAEALSASPLSERAGAVLAAALKWRSAREKAYDSLLSPEIADARYEYEAAVDALRAELDQPAPGGAKE